MDLNMERKVEASIPVQGRINVMVLAELVEYWDGQGKYIKSMSQLLNWSMDLCSQILKFNNQLPVVIDTVLDGNEVLVRRGLYQKGMMKRGQKRIIKARQVENLRLEGVFPDGKGNTIGDREYRHMHQKNKKTGESISVEPAPDMIGGSKMSDMIKIYEDLERQEREDANAESIRIQQEYLDTLPKNKHGAYITPVSGKNNYTDDDKDIDAKRGSISEAKELLKKVESIKVNPYDDRPRPLTDEELDKREEDRRLRDLAQAKLMDDMLIK